jgi:hypothetical protein
MKCPLSQAEGRRIPEPPWAGDEGTGSDLAGMSQKDQLATGYRGKDLDRILALQ